jgi:hypothetical protein
VTGTGSCTATASTTITVNPQPTASIAVNETSGSNNNDASICSGASATLTASGGSTYVWNTGAITAAITVSPGSTTTYSVTVTGTGGCTATAAQTITVSATPLLYATTVEPTTCASADGSINLTVTPSGSYTFLWSNGATTEDISNVGVGTYSVTVTNTSGCTAGTSVTLSGPGGCGGGSSCPTIGSASVTPSPICEGQTVTLSAAGLANMGSTYGISFVSFAAPTATPYTGGTTLATVPNGSLTGGGTGASASVVMPAAGTYYIYAILSPVPSDPTCRPSATTSLVVNALPTATISVAETSGLSSNDGTICTGATATLTAAGGSTYAWSNGSTGAAITVSPASTTTYTVTVTTSSGCTGTASTTITVNPLPSASVAISETSGVSGNDGIICNGASATLTAAVGGTYLWSTGATTASITVTPSLTTTYNVTVTNTNGCSATASGTVTVNPLPTASVAVTETSGVSSNDGIVCNGASATLTASGGTTYLWSNGAATASINVTPSVTTIYTVTVTNANNCSATATVTITVNPLPTASVAVTEISGVANNDGTICNGATATLTASGGTTYLWSNGAATASINVTPSVTTIYTVTVTNANNCSATATVTITVNPLPTAAIAVTETSGVSSNDGTVCAGASATLTASGGTAYLWSNGANTAAITVTPASTTTYTVTVTNAANCSTTTTTTITVNPQPSASISVAETSGVTNNDGVICNGASVTLTASGGATYLWSNGAATASITVAPSSNTTYTVTVTNAGNCSGTAATTITVNPIPTAAIAVTETSGIAGNDGIICSGATATLTASGGTAYLWSTGANTQSINVAPGATTTYSVTVTSAGNCSSATSRVITVNPLPSTYAITGGGGYCQGTDPGVPVGLAGSQTGVNYQLQYNGINVGAPVAGTGAALNFGPQTNSGNYAVIATSTTTGCMVTMTGSISVFTMVCAPSISDPCVCLNNATNLSNGQFGEQIKVSAPSNQTWTVTAVNGLYTTNSAAPPAAPTPITVGTQLTSIGGNMFTLDGRHVDALGYTISVSNGLGTTLSIGNSCVYPNPAISTSLTGPFCQFSTPVPLTGDPGDANIVSQSFKVNGVPATSFDPSAGFGQYLIEYTVNGGTPKAAGPNDPGCIQTVSQYVQVIQTPAVVTCNDLIHVSLDADCSATISADDLLEGSYGCYDDYLVEIDRTLPYGNGPWTSSTVTSSDINKTYQYRVTHLVSGNRCWGNVKIEDKLSPVITCTDITLYCPNTTYDASYLQNTLGIATAFPTVVDCDATTTNYVDTWHDASCGQGFNGQSDLSAYVDRKWMTRDASGNTAECHQYLYFKRLHNADLTMPNINVTVACSNGNTSPAVTGVPSYNAFGRSWGLYPDPGFCELQIVYNDQHLPVCDGTYKIVRTWTILDGCAPAGAGNPRLYSQVISVVDQAGPAMTCPDNFTVSVEPTACCAFVDMPDIVIEDACSRINNIGGMVTTFEQYTGVQTGMILFGGAVTDFGKNNYWDLDTLAAYGQTSCLPQGTHTVTYTAQDDCGNTSTCTFRLTVADYVPPVASCDETTTVAVGVDDPFDCYGPGLDACKFGGVTTVNATSFDDGSYDQCNGVEFTVRRMSPYSDCIESLNKQAGTVPCDGTNNPTEYETATGEAAQIKFYGCEVGTTQTVVLRVYQVDVNGNRMNGDDGLPVFNECMIQVEVQDKIKPVCVPPQNYTVTCEQFDPSLWLYGKASVSDNVCLDETKNYLGQCGLTHTASYTNFDTLCNKGTIVRTFRAFDCNGQSSQCTQRIVVNYEQDYFVRFPDDKIISVCDGSGDYGEPSFYGEDCELLGVTYEDEIFTVIPDACYKIERNWKVINWCTYNPQGSCMFVPNPNPNAITNHPTNLPGPIVSPVQNAGDPWKSTIVKINPSDAAATNYSVYYNANANCYTYKQIIKIIDTQDPVAQCPASPVTVCDITPNDAALWNQMYWWDLANSTHDLGDAPSDISLTASDACSGSNINFEYQLLLDLDGDGSMETVVNSTQLGSQPGGLGWNNVLYNNLNGGGISRQFDDRPVAPNQKWGFAIQEVVNGNTKTASVKFNTQQAQNTYVTPQLSYGTHKIKWFITDGCGNEAICEYTIIVKDCKAPTVVCYNGLSVNIMPTGMITMNDVDFLEYTVDNYSQTQFLRTGIRKCGTGSGFPFDANGNPIRNVTFNCSELGTQCVELWSIDIAGNADYCETYVIVQDNNGNCPNSDKINVSGALKTEDTNGVEEASISLSGSVSFAPPFSYFDMDLTDADGQYKVLNAVPVSASFKIIPEKDDNPLNGVTTYDLVLISKHILGIEPLGTPYRMIAADANKSNSVTTFDIVELRKLILGIYTELPNNTSWRFVDKAQVFANPANPFAEPIRENISVQQAMNHQFDQNFTGVKVGDVNGTAVANSVMQPDARTNGTLLFDVQDREVKAGEVFEVTFSAADKSQGYQMTLNLDGLSVAGIRQSEAVNESNFGIFADALTVSVDGADAFTVTFRAEKSGRLSGMVGVSSRITKAEGYSLKDGRMDVALRYDGKTIAGAGFELYQNQPNPFVNKTLIGFNLPEASAATLTVYDETGRMVFTQKGDFAKGYNTVAIDRALLNTNGVLYYTLTAGSHTATRKMIQTK